MHSFIHSFIHSFVPSFARPSVRPSVCPFVRSFVRSFVPSFIRSFVHSGIPVGFWSTLACYFLTFIHSSLLCSFTGQRNGHEYSLPKYSFENARRVFDDNDLDDILYTFGVEKSGQLVLHNYPKTLMELKIPRHQAGGEQVRQI